MGVFREIGASNHTAHERQPLDYYATTPVATEYLVKLESLDKDIWECACGGGHMSEVLIRHGHNVRCSDIYNYGGNEVLDFLSTNEKWHSSIITNPPYKHSLAFVKKALEIIPEGKKVCMFLKVTFLEGKERGEFFKENPPCRVWVSSSRLKCAMNGDFENLGSSATAYAWFIWIKGYKGETIVKWFN